MCRVCVDTNGHEMRDLGLAQDIAIICHCKVEYTPPIVGSSSTYRVLWTRGGPVGVSAKASAAHGDDALPLG